jgi:heat shock protein HtpX
MLKRVLLFFITLSLIVITSLTWLSLSGISVYIKNPFVTYTLIILSILIWGSLVALLFLRTIKFFILESLPTKIIDAKIAPDSGKWLLDKVANLASYTHLPTLPQLCIQSSIEAYALVIGQTSKQAVIIVSTGLLQHFNQDELEAILAQQLTYLARGNMLTKILLCGLIYAFTDCFARLLAKILALLLPNSMKRNKKNAIMTLITSALRVIFVILFTGLGYLVMVIFSRHTIYQADTDSAKLVGKEKMLSALKKLQLAQDLEDKDTDIINFFKVARVSPYGEFFSTHPSLKKRIEHLANQLNP